MSPMKAFFAAAMTGVAVFAAASAQAQSTQDMSLLSPEEKSLYQQRFEHASTSAERAKITAEMNRVVHQRRLEMRKPEQESAASHPPPGPKTH